MLGSPFAIEVLMSRQPLTIVGFLMIAQLLLQILPLSILLVPFSSCLFPFRKVLSTSYLLVFFYKYCYFYFIFIKANVFIRIVYI